MKTEHDEAVANALVAPRRSRMGERFMRSDGTAERHAVSRVLRTMLPFEIVNPDGDNVTGSISQGAWMTYNAMRQTIDENGITLQGISMMATEISRSQRQNLIPELLELGFVQEAGTGKRNTRLYRCRIIPLGIAGDRRSDRRLQFRWARYPDQTEAVSA